MSERQQQRSDVAAAVRLAMFAAGMALISYGAWLICEPAGYMAGGFLMFGCAIAGEYRAGRRP